MPVMRNKCLIFIVICTLSASGSLFGQLPRIKVDGNKFVNDQNEEIVFRGYNTSDPDKLEKDGHWNDEYFAQIKEWGGNIVRFPVHPPRWRERGKESYLDLLDEGIELAEKYGLYVIIDWHSIGNLRSELFFLPIYETSKKETFEFWQLMAERYGQNPTVAFFELYNEPTTYNGRLGVSSWSAWKALMEECITIIRGYGAKNIPLVAGFNWAYDLSVVMEDPIDAEGIGYVSHPYPQKRTKPWEPQWEKDWGQVSNHYPVILTEIGYCAADARGAHVPVIDDGSYVPAILDYTTEKGISLVIWVFDPHWSPALLEDWNFTPTPHGKVWKKSLTNY